MATCSNCGHQKHLHAMYGLGKCKADGCGCWSFSNSFKRFIKFLKG